MKYLIIFCLSIVIVFASCHKKDNKSATSDTTPTGNNTNTLCYGFLTSGNYTNEYVGGNIFSNPSVHAYFSSQATQYINQATAVPVGSVYFNADSLGYMSAYGEYLPQYAVINLSTETWSVNGANGIPTFTYASTDTYPSFTVSNLPDTIKKSIGFSVNINNVNGFTTASFFVSDGSVNVTGNFNVTLHSGNNSVTITPANMANFTTGSSASYVGVVLEKVSTVSISGKNFKFSHETQHTKQIAIVP